MASKKILVAFLFGIPYSGSGYNHFFKPRSSTNIVINDLLTGDEGHSDLFLLSQLEQAFPGDQYKMKKASHESSHYEKPSYESSSYEEPSEEEKPPYESPANTYGGKSMINLHGHSEYFCHFDVY